jgi:hypothetical protein
MIKIFSVCVISLDKPIVSIFDHNGTYDCQGYNLCENDGNSFEDNAKCPTSSICVCHGCYYGSKCQFSTKGPSLSLDVIFGYRIRQNTPINHHPVVIKTASTTTMTIFGLGLLNGLFSLMTFRSKKSRVIGCSIYLFTSSIISLITINMLTVKFQLRPVYLYKFNAYLSIFFFKFL